MGVLDLAPLLPPYAPALRLQVKGEWHSQEGSAEQLSLWEGRGRLSQFLPEGWGRGSCAGCSWGRGAGDLPGSAQESARSCPVPPSLPGWVLPSHRTLEHPSPRVPEHSPGSRWVLQHRGCLAGVLGLPLAFGKLQSLPGAG